MPAAMLFLRAAPHVPGSRDIRRAVLQGSQSNHDDAAELRSIIRMIAAALALVVGRQAPRRRRSRAVPPSRECAAVLLLADRQEGGARGGQRLRPLARAHVASRRSPTIPSSSASSADAAASACRRSASRARSAPASSSAPTASIVTNTHVVKGGAETEIRVALSDKREFDAKRRCAGRADRSRRAEDREAAAQALSVPAVRRLRQARGRRHRARHRQSVRRRPDGDERHHLGAGAHRDRRSPTRRSSSRPTPPSIRATRAARWST